MNPGTFPLTRLPASCSKNVVRIMSPPQLLAYSLLSKKCKNHVNSLNTSKKPMTILFSHGLYFSIKFQRDMLLIKIEFQDESLRTPRKVTFAILSDGRVLEECVWDTNRFEVKEWVEHLKFVFNNSDDIWFCFMRGSFRFDLESVKETFPNIPKLSILHTGSYEYNQLILQKLLPIEVVSISTNCFINSKIPHKILIQHFANLQYAPGPLTNIQMDDLLVNNSKRIIAPNSQISSKEFNKFLKLWINGANPRMEFLTVFISDGITLDGTIKGIKHQKMPKTVKRYYKFDHMKNLTLSGGVDISRMDGTKATIGVLKADVRYCIMILVWHDHCVE